MKPRSILVASLLALVGGVTGPIVAGASPADAARAQGGQVIDDIVAAANAAARPDCGLSGARLAAIMIPPTYPETGAPATVPPSPMTLSRWDTTSTGLYFQGDPNTPFSRAFFNPGVGIWQFDSAGLGRPHAASYYMNTQTAAPAAAATMASRWCFAWANPGQYPDDMTRLTHVWLPWHGCNPNTLNCHAIYNEVFDGTSLVNLQRFESVTRTGGMVARSCQDAASTAVVGCFWVNPALAQGYGAGSTAWANPVRTVNTPLSAPFYVYEFNGFEYRHWLAADTGYPSDITARRPLTGNARTSLVWSTGPGVCDLDAGRGACVPPPPLGPNRPVPASNPSIVGQGKGVGLVRQGPDLVIGDRRSDGMPRYSMLEPPFWSGWTYPQGLAMSDVEVSGWGTDHIELFITGGDRAIWRNVVVNGVPGGWVSLGGAFTSGPAAVSWAPGRTDVFARGLDGALWASYITDQGFSGWYSLGGTIISDPEVASWGPDRLDIFAAGADRQLWHRAWDGSGFQPWEPWGGVLTSSPAAASASANRIDVAVRGSNGAVYVRQWNGTSLTAWGTISGLTSSAPELTRSGEGTVTLVTRGNDNNLYRAERDVSGNWFAWARVP